MCLERVFEMDGDESTTGGGVDVEERKTFRLKVEQEVTGLQGALEESREKVEKYQEDLEKLKWAELCGVVWSGCCVELCGVLWNRCCVEFCGIGVVWNYLEWKRVFKDWFKLIRSNS